MLTKAIVFGSLLIIATSLTMNRDYSSFYYTAFAVPHSLPPPSSVGPTIAKNDTHLKIETVFTGLRSPTSMAFLGPNDILVLEKSKGTVQRIVNGTVLPKPILKVAVATLLERGMLGIAIAKHAEEGGHTYVFLYYTQSGGGKNGDDRPATPGGGSIGIQPLGNRLYRYELVGNALINPKLLLNLPAIPPDPTSPEANHNGGKVVVGPEGYVYVIIGDVGSHRGLAQNIANGAPLDGTGGVLRVTQDGQAVPNPILGGATVGGSGSSGSSNMSKYYYAYGIRNSFGIAFDPMTGKLWDTENGSSFGDEINLVDPGFNSGWTKIQGIWNTEGGTAGGPGTVAPIHPTDLVDLGGKGKYRPPEFSWNTPIAPTAVTFLNTSKLGKQYENDMFVADVLNGNIYDFKLNQNRTDLQLPSALVDRVANSTADNSPLIFARGFGGITDLQVGPDGYLYVLSYTGGTIYRILPSG
jgi:glucose/arabinose dehydrogenase